MKGIRILPKLDAVRIWMLAVVAPVMSLLGIVTRAEAVTETFTISGDMTCAVEPNFNRTRSFWLSILVVLLLSPLTAVAATVTIRPDSVVTATSWTGATAANLSDASDGTIATTTAANTLQVTLGNNAVYAGATINSATLWVRASSAGSGGPERVSFGDGITTASGISVTRGSLSDLSQLLGVLTPAEVDALNIYVTSGSAGETINIADIWVVVDYTVSSPENIYGTMTSMSGPLTADLSQQTVATVPVTYVLGGASVSSYTVNLNGTVGAGDVTGVYVTDGTNIWSANGSYGNGSSVVCLGANAIPGATLSIKVTLATTAASKTVIVTLQADSNGVATLTLPKGPSTELGIVAASGTSSTINTCSGCHGYPPVDNTGGIRDATEGTFAGDHEKHNYACDTCHASLPGAYGHRNGSIEFKVGTIGYSDDGTYLGGDAVAQTNNPSLSTCDNVNCHGNNNTGAWGGAGYASCTTSLCHGFPPTNDNTHTTHYDAKGWATGSYAFCFTCHPDVDYTTAHPDRTNGVIELGTLLTPNGPSPSITCSSISTTGCHNGAASTPAWNVSPSTITCTDCHTVGGTNSATVANPASGLHDGVPTVSGEQHDNSFGVSGTCVSCHSNPLSAHWDGTAQGGEGQTTQMGLATFYTQSVNDEGTCSNTSCHLSNSDAWEHKWDSTDNYYTTAATACLGCHGDLSGFNNGVDHRNTTGMAAMHQGTGTYKCQECHAIERGVYPFTFGSADWAPLNAGNKHGDGLITINDDVAGVGGDYTGFERGTGADSTKSTCAKCHGYADTPTAHDFVNTSWTPQEIAGGTIVVTCGSCHTLGVTRTGESGAHAAHNANNTDVLASSWTDCIPCHGDNGGSGYNVYTGTHKDNLLTLVGPIYSEAAGVPTGTCSSATCHYSQTTPAWNTTNSTTCTSCHNDGTVTVPGAVAEAWPSKNKNGTARSDIHEAHVTNTAYVTGANCTDCHGDNTTTHSSAFDGTTVTTGNKLTIYTTLDGTCTNSCHASTTADFRDALPTLVCSDCHNAGVKDLTQGAWPPVSNKHTQHVGTAANAAYGDIADHTTTTAYEFGCGNCHGNTATDHINGSVNITVTNWTAAAKTCGQNSCHNDGKATPGAPASTADWDAASPAQTCNICHGNAPTTGAHSAHAVGIHYQDIYTGTTGRATTGTLNTSSHGNNATSTTINCNLCHNGTVTTSRNRLGSQCTSCHSGDLATTNIAIADKTKHLDGGTTKVIFANVNVKSKAQVRNDITTVTDLNNTWSRTGGYKAAGAYDAAKSSLTAGSWNGTTCSTISCHNNNAITWTTPTSNCTKCHTSLP